MAAEMVSGSREAGIKSLGMFEFRDRSFSSVAATD